MGDFVAKDGVVNGKARATSLVPRRYFSSVVYQVGECGRRGTSQSGGIQILVAQSSFIKAVLREEGDTGVAFGEGPRVEFGFGGEAVLRLGSNVLEGDD